jgi:uncharacterized cupredoxin-like copper-binding protein
MEGNSEASAGGADMRALKSVAVGGFVALACACGGSTAAQPGEPANPAVVGQAVGVTLDEFKVQFDTNSVPAGKVTFEITNTGHEKHELVILRTDLNVNAIPENSSEKNKLTENGTGVVHVTEYDGVDPGKEHNLVADLPAGHYLLLCNYPGHAHAGMAAFFTVT